MPKITISEPYQHHASMKPGDPLIIDIKDLTQVSDGCNTIAELYSAMEVYETLLEQYRNSY